MIIKRGRKLYIPFDAETDSLRARTYEYKGTHVVGIRSENEVYTVVLTIIKRNK